MGLGAEGGQETAEGQGCLGDGERAAHLFEGAQLLIGRHHLRGSEVDAAQHHLWLLAWLHVGLDGLLAVELYGEVDDVATLHEAVGGRVGPAARYVDAHGRPSPHDLVIAYRLVRRHTVACHGERDAFAQQAESLPLPCGPWLARGNLRAEHGVGHALHERFVSVQWLWGGHVQLAERLGGIIEVKLVEHAVRVVPGQRLPVVGAILLPLCGETIQVGLGRYLLR